MINKYGNDIKNNIFWNKEYPFIPEVTNDNGFTIHEGDIVDFYDTFLNTYKAARVYKIYNKDLIWAVADWPWVKQCNMQESANFFLPHTSNDIPPKFIDFDNQDVHNPLETFLGIVYSIIYPEELNAEGDWHFDTEKFNRRRQEEVDRLKCKY